MNNEYPTTDFWLSAFLKAKGFNIIKVKKDKGRSVFIFENRPDREDLIREYYNNGLIEVSLFKNAVQDLKSIIHNT